MNARAILSILVGSTATVVLIAAWSVASPVGSVPDSSFHLSSIWCAKSAPVDSCPIEETIPGQPRARLPAELVHHSCLYNLPNGSPSCSAGVFSGGSATAQPNQLVELNPNGFYNVFGLLAGDPVEGRIVLMRIASGVSSAVVIGASALLLRIAERRRFLFLALTMHVPLGLLFATSVNSSGVSIAIVIAAVPLGLRLYRARTTKELLILAAGAGFLLLIASGVRRDTFLFAASVLLAMTAHRIGRSLILSRRRILLAAALTGAIGVLATQLLSSASDDALSALRGRLFADSAQEVTRELFLSNALRTILLWFAAIGGWSPATVSGLGFVEVAVPWTVPILLASVLARTVFQAQRNPPTFPSFAVNGILAMAWLVPFVALTAAGLRVGEQIQPRYILPLLAAGITAAGLADPRLQGQHSRLGWFDCGAIVIAHSLGLGALIAHYSFNKPITPGLLTSSPIWRWSTVSPTLTWAIGSLAFFVLTSFLCSPEKPQCSK